MKIETKRTKLGLISSIYTEQKNSSKERKHSLPNYTKEELVDWFFIQDSFNKLFEDWVASGFNKWDRPSVDRISNQLPYTLDNIQLTTFKENNDRSHIDASNGEFQELCSVDCFDLSSAFICTYKSIAEAARCTGLTIGAIHNACNKPNRAATKFLFKYSKDSNIPKLKPLMRTYVQYDEEGIEVFRTNNKEELLEYLNKKDISPLNKAIRKGGKYLGFTWKVSDNG